MSCIIDTGDFCHLKVGIACHIIIAKSTIIPPVLGQKQTFMRSFSIFSAIILLLLVSVSLTGLLHPELYALEKPSWYLQSVGQDLVDLLLVAPILGIATLYGAKGSATAKKIWAGALLYLVYTFAIYCFDVHFNRLFLLYCALLGISVYAALSYFIRSASEPVDDYNRGWLKLTGIYFLSIAVLFCLLWLSEIVPSISTGETPESLRETGLLTNPVHVLDLSIVLPGIFITGIGLLRGTRLFIMLAVPILTFFTLMDLTIAVLSTIMLVQDAGGNAYVAIFMVVLAIFSGVLLIIGEKDKP